jgi:hypothetical protein
MNDNDKNNNNILTFTPKDAKIEIDAEIVDSFTTGIKQIDAYTEAQRISRSLMYGFVKVFEERYGIKKPIFFKDSALLSILIIGTILRQRGIEDGGEVQLLNDIQEMMSLNMPDELEEE